MRPRSSLCSSAPRSAASVPCPSRLSASRSARNPRATGCAGGQRIPEPADSAARRFFYYRGGVCMVDARETGVRSEPEVWMEHRTPDRVPPSLQPEHDWSAASPLIRPARRPVGISGVDGRELRIPTRGWGPGKTVVKAGPAGLPIVYVLPGAGFDVVVSVDHLLAWGVGPDQVHAAAMANLGSGSAELAWTDEVSGRRKIVWLDRGDGMDAARILLGEVRTHLRSALGTAGRVLVGLPERDLLIAAGLAEGDADFPALFAQYRSEE